MHVFSLLLLLLLGVMVCGGGGGGCCGFGDGSGVVLVLAWALELSWLCYFLCGVSKCHSQEGTRSRVLYSHVIYSLHSQQTVKNQTKIVVREPASSWLEAICISSRADYTRKVKAVSSKGRITLAEQIVQASGYELSEFSETTSSGHLTNGAKNMGALNACILSSGSEA